MRTRATPVTWGGAEAAPIVTGPTGTTPQDAAMARGTICINAAPGTPWMTLVTHRQVFTSGDAMGGVVEFDDAAYPVPLLGGPEQNL